MRRLFEARLGASSAAILVCGLDQFSAVNARLGRTKGDEILLEIFNALVARLPAGAVAARLGGDTFVLAVPADVVDSVRSVAELPPAVNHLFATLAWSTGIAKVASLSAEWAAGLDHAHQAFDEAKRRGGNIALLHGDVGGCTVVTSGPPSRMNYGGGSRNP